MCTNNKLGTAPMSMENQVYLHDLFVGNYVALSKYAHAVYKGGPCEDLVQEVFLIAATKIDAVRNSPNPSGWLMRTLQNVIRKAIGKPACISLEDEMPCEKESPDSGFDGFILLSEACRKYLSEEDWQLLYKKSQGYSVKELAEEYSLGESACKMRLLRARTMLRDKLSHR